MICPTATGGEVLVHDDDSGLAVSDRGKDAAQELTLLAEVV